MVSQLLVELLSLARLVLLVHLLKAVVQLDLGQRNLAKKVINK